MKLAIGTLRYQSRKVFDEVLRQRLRELAGTHVRYGYRRLTVLLRREGWHVNAKRIYRLYREEDLIVRTKQRRKMARRRPVTGIVGDDQRGAVVLHSARPSGGERIHREFQWPVARRMFERGMVLIAGGRAAEADDVPRTLQSSATAQRPGGSDPGSFRDAAPARAESFYVDGARTQESLDRASGVRENRVNRGEKDLHCPKPLVSFVTENGSGSSWKVSYDPVREERGQVTANR